MRRGGFLKAVGLCLIALAMPQGLFASLENKCPNDFHSAWANVADRVWIGSEYWSNPLQDWRVSNGRAECITSAPNRNLHLLTRQLNDSKGDFQITVRCGLLDNGQNVGGKIGFRVGAIGRFRDYRDSVFKGKGIDIGVTSDGRIFINNISKELPRSDSSCGLDNIELRFTATPAGEKYDLVLTKHNILTGKQIGRLAVDGFSSDKLIGNIALVTNMRCWFSNWSVSGSKISFSREHTFGPILFSQYTLSKGIMKLTAQMPPIGEKDSHVVGLEILEDDAGKWKTIGIADIDKLSCTATFRVASWDSSKDIAYRLVYTMLGKDGSSSKHYFAGTIRREPTDKDVVVVAAFTGNKDFAFPNTEIVKNVNAHDPDVLFFSGDQIYEHVGGYRFVRQPLQTACLDYLRKWYMLGWAFRDLMRNRPTVTIPDDHDVYQANLWGASGRRTDKDDKGGYIMSPQFVNMVQRTQTNHLPDAYDPKPVEQNIGVYYTSMNYGRIDFAVIEDRKFKSGPAGIVPPTKSGRADHVIDPDFDPETADVPQAKLLGQRQLDFLEDWTGNWQNTDMKVVLSQTIFANVANLHGADKTRLVADYDSNGWPQHGRNKALGLMRKGFAFHIAGDQHLATIVRHGIENWGDAGYSFCVPSIAAGYPRSWLPFHPGKDRKPGMPEYTGKFLDGLGNHITVLAAANPEKTMKNADTIADLRAKASGYGIVRLNKKEQTITMECWPIDENPTDASSEQFAGWPMKINVTDNYGKAAKAYLPTIKVAGTANPVVQVINQSNNQIVYTLRMKSDTFSPKVFEYGTYSIKVGQDGAGGSRTIKDIQSVPLDNKKIIYVEF